MRTEGTNFISQAIPEIENSKESFIHAKMPATSEVFAVIVDALRSAVKFRLPDNGSFFSDSRMSQSDFDIIRLPYPVIAAEYRMTNGKYDNVRYASTTSDMRISLAMEIYSPEAIKILKICFGPLHEMIIEKTIEIGSGYGFLVWPVFYLNEPNAWCATGGGLLVPCGAQLKDVSSIDILSFDEAAKERWQMMMGRRKKSNGFHATPILPPDMAAFRLKRNNFNLSLTRNEVFNDVQDEVNSIINLCHVLNCKNVITEDLCAPTALNKKRAKIGKQPLYDYKTLKIEINKTPGIRRHSESAQGRSSPRMHLRRGHIRRLPPDRLRMIWVQAAVVGNKGHGFLNKDYEVISSINAGEK